MYKYLCETNKEFLVQMKKECRELMDQLKKQINRDGFLFVDFELVGSGARNLETQNENEDVDLDFNLIVCGGDEVHPASEKEIKEYVKEAFNKVLKSKNLGSCKDSTSVLTAGPYYDDLGHEIGFFIDLAIVKEENGGWYRLIHEKTGDTKKDKYYWVPAPKSKGLTKKVEWLKHNGHWNMVRKTYLKKKNFYQQHNDDNHPSFVCYIETINEVYTAKIQK